jgi:excisionase family DNA binding protein
MSENEKKELFSLKELSERTGKTYRTLHRYTKDGKIKTIRLGGSVMVPKREVERILTNGF